MKGVKNFFVVFIMLASLFIFNEFSLAATAVEDAITWAEGQIGFNKDDCGHNDSRKWEYMCMHFCGHAYGIVPSGIETAVRGWKINDGTFGKIFSNLNFEDIPRGALVFFSTELYPAGHVGISVGNGQMVHAWVDGVRRDEISELSQYYLGWRWPTAWTSDEIPDTLRFDCSTVQQMFPDFFIQEGIADCIDVYFTSTDNTYSIWHNVYLSQAGYWGPKVSVFQDNNGIAVLILGASTSVTPTLPGSPPVVDPSVVGFADGNVEKVKVSRAGKDKWEHSLTLAPGEKFDIKTGLENKGSDKINNAQVRYYHTDEGQEHFTPNSNHYYGDDDKVDIEAGQKVTEHKRNLKAPSTPGSYRVYVYLHCDSDSNPSNNLSRDDDAQEFAEIEVLPNNFKLSQAILSASSVLAKDFLNLRTWSINEGANVNHDIQVYYYLSVGNSYNNPTLLGYDNIQAKNFVQGAKKEESFDFQAPENPGIYTLSAQLDGVNVVSESNEYDNWVHLSFEVKPRPAPAPPMSITILDPVSGVKWRTDKEKTIRWQSNNFPQTGYVDVEYSKDGGASWQVIEAHTPNDGSKRWDKGKPNISKDYRNVKVRVRSCEYPNVVGVSGTFTLDHKK